MWSNWRGRRTQPHRSHRGALIEQKLKDAGIKLVAVNPGYALSNLDQATRQPKTGGNFDDLDDMLDDLDD